MLDALLFPLAPWFEGFNLFRYITFRSGGACVTALAISFLCGPRIIAWLRERGPRAGVSGRQTAGRF